MPRNESSIHGLPSVAHYDNERATNIGDKLDMTLKIENMLLEEFSYASTTAYQAMEDRARMFNLYLLLVGIVISALGVVYQLGGSINT